MVYIIRNADNTIKSFTNNEDDVLMNDETRETVAGSFAAYAGRFVLSADKTTINADDTDEATVTLTTNTGASSIDVSVNGVTVTVSLTDGVGQLPPITAIVAGEILIEPADKTAYAAAGNGTIVITAEEVE